MRIFKCILFLIIIVLAPSIAYPQMKPCALDEAKAAENTASTIESWSDLYINFKKYEHCDDGAIAEGFSESVSLLFVNKWKKLNQFEKLSKKDPSFAKFVYKHLDETIPRERVERIQQNAEQRCLKSMHLVCIEIRQSLKLLKRSN